MKTILRNILAVILGFVGGCVVNKLLVDIGPSIVPLPEGVDVTNLESLRASMELFAPRHFIFPFLGHALGTLTGAFIAAKIAVSHHRKFALVVGCLFLMGGAFMIKLLGGPLWFKVCDLVLAYLPMAFWGGLLACRKPSEQGDDA
ncbi:MAG: hypothetical protein ACJASX_004469 [Limisphaerales bacterium]|jgi:hypothetical protein